MYTLNFNSETISPSSSEEEEFQVTKTRRLFKSTFLATTLVVCATASLLLVLASPIAPITHLEEKEEELASLEHQTREASSSSSGQYSSCTSRRHHDRPLTYHKPPSPHLLSKLREYEQRHKRCEPLSQSFNRTFFHKSSSSPTNDTRENKNASTTTTSQPSSHIVDEDCNYLVFARPTNGLGNRMLSLSSAFLYALLTSRVLLVDFGPDMTHLFCEPFPNTTWLLPEDYRFGSQLYGSKGNDFGSLMKNNKWPSSSSSLMNNSSFLHVNLGYGYDDYEKLFFSDGVQDGLQRVPWLILKSDQYFVPYLFLMSSFRTKLDIMFPNDRETVFHHLGRYLFTPSNQAWGLITRFYDAYLAKADQRIGLQIRVVNPKASPTSLVLKQVLRCTQKEAQILPPLLTQQNETTTGQKLASGKTTSSFNKAVLVASLSSEFYTELKDMYWKRSSDGEAVAVGFHQASHEEVQRSDDGSHNMMAWVDIYLLSLCDVLVTSGWSTFGYVAQGLGGLRPWILQIPDTKYGGGNVLWGPACRRAASMEPCFHFPPSYGDDGKVGGKVDGEVGGGSNYSGVVHCEDVGGGLKLVNVQKLG